MYNFRVVFSFCVYTKAYIDILVSYIKLVKLYYIIEVFKLEKSLEIRRKFMLWQRV